MLLVKNRLTDENRAAMDLRQIPLFEMMTQRMSWLTQRQKVLAQNVANADTPDYVPRDLVKLDFERVLGSTTRRLKMWATAPSHITDRTRNGEFRDAEMKKTYDVAPAGNSVVIEEQLIKVADTRMDFELTSTLYKKSVKLFSTAIGRR